MDERSHCVEPLSDMNELDKRVLMTVCGYFNGVSLRVEDISEILSSPEDPNLKVRPSIDRLYDQDYITLNADRQFTGPTPLAMRVYEDIKLHRETYPKTHWVGWPSKYVD
jgi:hypothetical protein